MDEPDFQWLMIDACHCKVHPHVAEFIGGQSDDEPNKRGCNTKSYFAVDALGLLVRLSITEATGTDCTKACSQIEGFEANYLLVDREYNMDEIINKAESMKDVPVIPPRKNRKIQRERDKNL